MNKFRFNFDRAIVVAQIIPWGNTNYRVTFVSKKHYLEVKEENMRFIKTMHLNDTSVIVADMGSEGFKTDTVVIAADSLDRISDYFFRNNIPFPKCKK